MSRPEKLIPPSLEEAVAELKRDPSQPVHARIDGLDVELRIIPSSETQPSAAAHGLVGLCADLGQAPSSQEIDDARREMWAAFPRADV